MEEIVLFGASKLGEIAFEHLKNKYNIIAFIDNDKNKWGKNINEIEVLNPECIKNNRSYKVIITSAYYLEIIDQLNKLGIEDIEIYFSNNMSNGFHLEKIVEVNINKSKGSNILLIISFYSIYIEEYIKNIYSEYEIKVDILTRDKLYLERIDSRYVNNIYYYNNYEVFSKIIRCNQYQCIHLHYVEQMYCKVANVIRENCQRFIITYWGSDFYRQTNNDRILEKKMLNDADIITFDNESMLKEFCTELGDDFRSKCVIKRFGLSALDYIKNNKTDIIQIKRENDIPEDKIIIMCGYNGKKEQNHIPLIKSIVKLDPVIKEKIYLVVPMTYGVLEYGYVLQIKEMLEEGNIQFKILEKFMDFVEISNLTKIVDIMIHVQTTDSLSATMLEHLYAGNIVIAGNWLPYDELKDINVEFISIDIMEDITYKISGIVNNIDEERKKYEVNSKIIYELSSWNNNVSKWNELYI
jgi:hypothetical protein